MNATQQHLLDAYRAAQHGETAPPAPGTRTVRTVREIQQWRRFQAVIGEPEGRLAGRIAGRIRRALRAVSRRHLPADPTRSA
ncbi:hypothetical protein ACFY12_33415 [Streptomyces sp. NPDC001339]|uniref:hypothetical protein n=1 Tax=Streptomyces sp. NPDC001339 TaxID=3364563 RepID=UPI00367B7B80